MARLRIGCCITAHGFGHAARTMAIMEILAGMAEVELTIVSQVPEWFFQSSYSHPFSYVPVQTDVGLVQQGPLEQDISATVAALSGFYPLRDATRTALVSVFAGCDLVVCDVSPAGILAAREAGVTSVLVENFTWDWIYEGYSHTFPDLEPFIVYLRDAVLQADYRIQTEPICRKVDCDLVVPPVARPFRMGREQVRNKLEIDEDKPFALISMGGVSLEHLPLNELRQSREVIFVLSGYTGPQEQAPNIRFLPNDTDLFHPDIVRASDAVIGKVGYSTLAEVYHADVPWGYVSRQDFRESAQLGKFIMEEMTGIEIAPSSFADGTWLDVLPQLLDMERKGTDRTNGAPASAEFLLSLQVR